MRLTTDARFVSTILSSTFQRILKNIKDDAYVVCLCIDGKQLDSEELSEKMEKLGKIRDIKFPKVPAIISFKMVVF